MPTLVAIDIKNDMATLVTAETSATGTITLLDTKRVSVEEIVQAAIAEEAAAAQETSAAEIETPEEESDEDTESTEDEEYEEAEDDDDEEYEETEEPVTWRNRLEKLLARPIDSTIATLPSEHVLFEYLTLPFRDQTKIDQIVPLQIQDMVPFELNQFIVDSIVVGEKEGGNYNIVSSLVPEKDVQGALDSLSKIGADPKLLTTKAAALTALPQFLPEELSGNFALVALNSDSYSFAAFVDAKPCLLREIPFTEGNRFDLSVLAQDLRCSLAKLEVDLKTEIRKAYAIGMDEGQLRSLSAQGLNLSPLNLASFVEQNEALNGSANNVAWAVALFANEVANQKRSKTRLIDFRRGDYAYKPAWGNLWGALQEEIYYIGLAVFFALVWVGTVVFTNARNLDRIETAIQDATRQYMPGITLTEKQEFAQAQKQLEDLKTQLEEFGSIAQLSPLDAIKSLASIIPKSLDISFDAVNIGREGVSFSGSVPENRQIGELSKVLTSQQGHFCNVSVEPKGKVPGSNRVRFSADITFCQ